MLLEVMEGNVSEGTKWEINSNQNLNSVVVFFKFSFIIIFFLVILCQVVQPTGFLPSPNVLFKTNVSD